MTAVSVRGGRRRSHRLALGAALSCVLAAACSFNPATGRMQLGLVSEEQEVELGRTMHEHIERELPVYTESFELTQTVADVGHTLARKSERPDLPWTFTILDDPSPNAFAVPGGFIYVTRGLLAHLNSNDELAAVLAHEVGHVTARHGAVALRKQTVAQRSLDVLRVVDPELRHVGRIAEQSAVLALRSHSRRAERQADDLAITYIDRAGFEAAAFVEVLDALAGLERAEGSDVPPWLRTHPEAMGRRDEAAHILGVERDRTANGEPGYLSRVDGLRFGEDPRDGYVVGQRFVHPRQGFNIELPPKWRVLERDGMEIVAESEDGGARIHIAPLPRVSPQEAFADLFREESVAGGQIWQGNVGGYKVVTSAFALKTGYGMLRGLIAFIDADGQTLMALGWGPDKRWQPHADEVARSFSTLGKLRDPLLRNVEPMRIRVVTTKAPQTIAQFAREQASAVTVEELALLNHVAVDEPLKAGTLLKTVTGFNPRLLPSSR